MDMEVDDTTSGPMEVNADEVTNISSGGEHDRSWFGFVKEWTGFEELVASCAPAPDIVRLKKRECKVEDGEPLEPGFETRKRIMNGLAGARRDIVHGLAEVTDRMRTRIGIRSTTQNNTVNRAFYGFSHKWREGLLHWSDTPLHFVSLDKEDSAETILKAFPIEGSTSASISAQRFWLGDLGHQMVRDKLRYGFLSTTTWTIFVKLQVDEDGVGTLLVSKPVNDKYTTLYDDVSMEQAMWYLTSASRAEPGRVEGYDEAATRAAAYQG